MSGSQRLPAPWGRLINRAEPVEFKFAGRSYTGLKGDTISSALAANGRWVLSRSFKYHRPRASASFTGWDANSYIQLGKEPNVAADLTAIGPDLEASAQNVLGSLDRDWGSMTRWLKRFMPVGFYYRAFFRPNGIWSRWERLIRRSAGLGRIHPDTGNGGYYDKEYLFTDVAVVGGGPAGLSAALEAVVHGASVLLIEEGPVLGGSLNYARFGRNAEQISECRDQLVAKVESSEQINVMTMSTCSGWFADNWLSVHGSNRLYKIRAKQVVLATGSVEQAAIFRNNDLPGVMTGSAAQRLMRLYGVRPGKRAVVITTNTDGYDVARDLIDAGVEVAALVNVGSASIGEPPAGITRVPDGLVPLQVRATRGKKAITGVDLALAGETQSRLSIDCDLLITSIGYAPLGQLACHQGGYLKYDENVHAFRVEKYPDCGAIAGSLNHCYELETVLADGRSAGARAAGQPSQAPPPDIAAAAVNHPYPIWAHPGGDDYVDFDEDQTVKDLINAVADGFDHPELAKRYSTTAMGPSQGRMSATNALRIVVHATGGSFSDKAITTQRPPFRPVSFGLLAGRQFEPERLTAMHDWHVDNGAELMPAGLWQRPACYGADRDSAIEREVAAIRNGVGLIDVSTLGGIDIRGPDATQLLNRMYTLSYSTQPVGKIRYLLMIDDSGSITDDGVAAHLGIQHFYITTTTTGSDGVYRSMLKRKQEWQLDVEIINLTSTFAAMNIAGPATRNVLTKLVSDINFTKKEFPYLAVREGHISGIPVRAMRVGFVGELGFELHVPRSSGLALWKSLMAAGKAEDIKPVGVEAQRILRLEKGHIIVGQDTDGLTSPLEAGMGWAVNRKKPYFIGRAALRCFEERPLARKLVGFELPRDTGTLPEECNLVIRNDRIAGRVTSIAHSVELNKIIGLAYVFPDDSLPGSRITIKRTDGHMLEAMVVDLPFLDPDGARQEQ